MMEDITNIAFQLILFAGNGRSNAMEAMQAARRGDYEVAEELLEAAGSELRKAHEFQTKLIQGEADGEAYPINILLIHAQDHLMTAMTVRDLAAEIIQLYQRK